MKRNILLYNFAVDTTDDRFHMKFNDVKKKIQLIKNKLIEMEKELRKDEYKGTESTSIRAIFVAPEYFFARSAPEYYSQRLKMGWNAVPRKRRGRHYESEEYFKIRQGLTKLSQQHQKILIIPGTIAWKEAKITQGIAPSTSSSSSNSASVPSFEEGSRMSDQVFIKLMRSMGEKENHIQSDLLRYKRETPDTQVLETQKILRADVACLYGGAGITPEKKKAIIENITDKTMTTQGYDNFIAALQQAQFGLAWNTAYFYLGGNKVWQYSKHSDYQESVYYQELSVAVNHDGPSTREIHGLTIGIEICLDHNCDVLKKYILANRRKKPDIHLILSACVENKDSQGKVLIHSSSNPSYNAPKINRDGFFKGAVGITFSVDQEVKKSGSDDLYFQKFKKKVNELVSKKYSFQVINRLENILAIKMIPTYNQLVQEREIDIELTKLIELFNDVLTSKGIKVEFNRLSFFEVEINSSTHLQEIEELLFEAGFKYLPKKIRDRNRLFSSSSVRSLSEKDPFTWPTPEEEGGSPDSPNIISCALQ